MLSNVSLPFKLHVMEFEHLQQDQSLTVLVLKLQYQML